MGALSIHSHSSGWQLGGTCVASRTWLSKPESANLVLRSERLDPSAACIRRSPCQNSPPQPPHRAMQHGRFGPISGHYAGCTYVRGNLRPEGHLRSPISTRAVANCNMHREESESAMPLRGGSGGVGCSTRHVSHPQPLLGFSRGRCLVEQVLPAARFSAQGRYIGCAEAPCFVARRHRTASQTIAEVTF